MKKLLFLLLIPFVFACSKDDETVEQETKVRISTYKMSGTDSVSQSTDMYIFKGNVEIVGGVDLIEKGLSAYKSNSNASSFEAEVEPGTYTAVVQLPLYLSQGPGAYSFKTFTIKAGESLLLKKTFAQYNGSFVLDPWK